VLGRHVSAGEVAKVMMNLPEELVEAARLGAAP